MAIKKTSLADAVDQSEELDPSNVAVDLKPKKVKATKAADTELDADGNAIKKAPAEKKAPKTPRKSSKVAASDTLIYGVPAYQPAKGEEYMSDGQVEHFKQVLTNWKAELLQEVDRTMTYIQDESTALADVNDRATQEEEFAIELRTRDRERKLIHKIEQSIQAIKTGDYGFCETCGIDIGLRRLEARPTATQCIDCKTLSEIKERQEHG